MKRSELKRLIKSIVKECIQESLLEDGILSSIISEVAIGLNSTNTLIKEEKQTSPKPRAALARKAKGESEALKVMQEERKKMLDVIGNDSFNGVNLFEGTEPLASAGEPGQQHAPHSALDGRDPRDSGIDISNMATAFGNTWRAIKDG